MGYHCPEYAKPFEFATTTAILSSSKRSASAGYETRCMDAPTLTVTGQRPLPAGGATSAFVSLQDVTKIYPAARGQGVLQAVDGVSLSIARGETLGLVGESGCGKSTIARLLVGLEIADLGVIRIDGHDRRGLSTRELKTMRRRVQLIFQDPFAALDPRMRLGVSLDAPLSAHSLGTPQVRSNKIVTMLDAVGLDMSFLNRFPRECSGGQLQRIVIARALLLEPDVLICDEPTSALDASVRAQILNLLITLRQRFSLTILMISHDLRVVRFMCDHVAVMYLGQIVETAPRDALFNAPRHPYTKALIAGSMIDKNGLHDPAAQLIGDPPSARAPPTGCRFHPRCGVSEAMCAVQQPSLDATDDGRAIRCHRWRALSAV
jgi:oligopeptide/dipeptide ABC transporter ATP-binding protein